MARSSRRRFLKEVALGVSASAALLSARSRAAGAAERVRIAVIGCGNQGNGHLRSLAGLKDAEAVYACDIDERRLATSTKATAEAKPISDFRRILDDKSIDGVIIATPDHWHAPIAIMALDAGKHVYVEKPCAHNVRECQLLRDAAHRSSKVVAHGTQARSNPAMQQAMALLRDGVIGEVLQSKCWNWQKRKDIGRLKPSAPPSGIDYDTWVGPAEWMPYQANRFHYDWHWWYNFGCGDLGNDGIHEFDYALWGLGVDKHPTVVSAAGGKYFFDDDQQFPDTQQVAFEFGDSVGNRRMFVFEMRLWSTTYPYNVDSGAEYFGAKGRMFISKRGKFEVRGERNEPVNIKLDNTPKSEIVDNQRNWLDCIKSGGVPNANIEVATRTATACHLANIATRLHRTLRFDPVTEKIIGDEEANALLVRKYRADGHWGVPAGV